MSQSLRLLTVIPCAFNTYNLNFIRIKADGDVNRASVPLIDYRQEPMKMRE